MNRHRNNIGVLRLAFASAVIIGHAPEMIDGDRSREPLAQIMPAASLGSFAVSGFFLLSGYLITASMVREGALVPYLIRRAARILPGFLIAYVGSVLILGARLGLPLGSRWRGIVGNLLFLKAPPVFPEMRMTYPSVNGALWTIAYEARCYVLVALLWKFGLLTRRRFMLALAGAAVLLTIPLGYKPIYDVLYFPPRWFDLPFGQPTEAIGFFATFLVGACVYLFREEIVPRLGGRLLLASLAVSFIGFQFEQALFFSRAVLLAVPVFWLAFRADLGPAQRVNDRWDISYETYLYGWPIAITIFFFHRGIDPWILAACAVPLAWIAGILSWHLIERWPMSWSKRVTS